MITLNLLSPATNQDRAAIIELLTSQNLPTADLPVSLANFLVARDPDIINGTVGLELYGTIALLRSLAVAPNQQGKGLGNLLYQAAINLAKDKGIVAIYLITNTAEAFFTRQGFMKVERAAVPEAIRQTSQFTTICPVSATIMCRKIN
ncbi:hypothetical protein AAE02nite_50160 [Adhaeribacter aerolatus]|uniref:N-acetyltransferase domain-containing protein n=1 Tax=Adhaeribacter aerolatus TaxID=670289 RepID=A0A512B5V8_9BACT|nr:arsenic resistance N-acetyltransferase ArsN2 [Adhaeribacter aerolatus]GEO07352.1 hypothetical protein AAE02nite_50160 [Adhaeribacter aerolatus]